MAIQIKDPTTLGNKYANRAGAAAQDYANGVLTPKRPQSASAIAAIPTWQAAVASPNAAKKMQKGLAASGDAGWQAGVASKGVSRYPQGVKAAQSKWVANVTPYLQVLAGLTLPAKGLRGDPGNQQRSVMVQAALNQARVSRLGG